MIAVTLVVRSGGAPPQPALLDDTSVGPGAGAAQGLDPVLRVGGPAGERAYLRFDLRGRRGPFRRVLLRLRVIRGSARGLVVRAVGQGTWGECATTGADAPPVLPAGERARVSPGTGEREFDVTRLVAPGRVVSLALLAPSADLVEIASRESDERPALSVVDGSGGPPSATAAATSGPADLPAPPAGAVVSAQADRFGIAAGGRIQYEPRPRVQGWLADLAELGPRWVRPDVSWADVEARGPDRPDWSRVDRVIRGARAGGVGVVGQIGYTPAWARPPGAASDKYPPTDPEAFARFAAQAARRYAPLGVHHWEIWNEPNIAGFWMPRADPTAYAQLLVDAAAAIRAADPEAVIILGGLAPAADDGGNRAPLGFLRDVYAAGAKCAFDAVGFHPYGFPRLPTSRSSHNAWRWMDATSPSVRSLMTANGDERKQIWATEFGAPTAGTDEERVDPERQAEILSEGYRLAAADPWLGPVLWYTLADLGTGEGGREDSFGLIAADGRRTPAWTAYRQAEAEAR